MKNLSFKSLYTAFRATSSAIEDAAAPTNDSNMMDVSLSSGMLSLL